MAKKQHGTAMMVVGLSLVLFTASGVSASEGGILDRLDQVVSKLEEVSNTLSRLVMGLPEEVAGGGINCQNAENLSGCPSTSGDTFVNGDLEVSGRLWQESPTTTQDLFASSTLTVSSTEVMIGGRLENSTATIAMRPGFNASSTLSDVLVQMRSPGPGGASSSYRFSCGTSTDQFPNSIVQSLSGVINGTPIATNTKTFDITPTTTQDNQHAIGTFTLGPRDWLICQLELGLNGGGICGTDAAECEAPSSSVKNLNVRVQAKATLIN